MLREASVLLRQVAEPRRPSVKETIAAVARKLNWKPSRAKELWYARVRRIDAHEMDALRREAQKQADRYERVARAMEQTNPHLHSQDIARLVHAARTLRGAAVPRTDPAGGVKQE
jgi:hypothetical protein